MMEAPTARDAWVACDEVESGHGDAHEFALLVGAGRPAL